MKKKYRSMDNRTGYNEGAIVELTGEELNKLPFNVYMESVDEEKDEEKAEVQKEKDDLRILLLNKGLSTQRTEKVVEKYGSLEELEKNLSKAGIDELTDEFLKEELSIKKVPKPVESKGKSVEKKKDEVKKDGLR